MTERVETLSKFLVLVPRATARPCGLSLSLFCCADYADLVFVGSRTTPSVQMRKEATQLLSAASPRSDPSPLTPPELIFPDRRLIQVCFSRFMSV